VSSAKASVLTPQVAPSSNFKFPTSEPVVIDPNYEDNLAEDYDDLDVLRGQDEIIPPEREHDRSRLGRRRRRERSDESRSSFSQSRSGDRKKRRSRHHHGRTRRHESNDDRSFIPKDVQEVPEGHILIKTSLGHYIIPDYDKMTPDEQLIQRNTFVTRFQILNDAWNKHDIRFDPPREGEPLSAIHIRYKQSVRYVMARSGATIWKLILLVGWFSFEFIACKFGYKASGYTESQVAIYDIYQTQMVELGEIGGFGQDWPAWAKVLVISCVNAAIFVLINTLINNGGGASTPLMKMISNFILGHNTAVDTKSNEHGVPTPVEANEMPSIGGINLGSVLGGGGGGGFNLSSILGSFGSAFTSNIQNNANGGNGGNSFQSRHRSNGVPDAPTGRRRRRDGK
jgi:hypothetical protein